MARVFDVTLIGNLFDTDTSQILRLLTLPVLPLQYADSLRKTEPERVPTTVPLLTVSFI